METKKVYGALDLAKFVMAVLILLGHTANEWAHSTGILHYLLSCDFTVPTFFAISGFLFFNKLKQMNMRSERVAYYKKWSVRILKMYLVWTLIYFVFVLTGWIQNGVTLIRVLKYLMFSVTAMSYATIWFLPALWMGMTICFLLFEYCPKKGWVYTIILVLWTIGLLGDPYRFVLIPKSTILTAIYNQYMDIFCTFRDGMFYAVAYLTVGYLLANRKYEMSLVKSGLGVIVFQALFLVEAIFIKRYNPSSNTDMAIFMLPSAYFILAFLLKLNIKSTPFLLCLRDCSMLIFLGQRLFLTAIPSVLPDSFSQQIVALPELVIYLIFATITILFAVIVAWLSKKYSCLRVLM